MSILPRSLIRKIIHLCLACILIFLVSSPSINSQAQVVQPPDGTPEEIFQLTPVANQSEIPDPYISPSAVPAGLTGVWFGWITVDPAFGNKTFSTLIALQDVNIGELAGLIMHPSNRCGGETRLVSTGKDIVTMATDYTFGACIDGRHRLELNSDGTMLYEWHDPNSERVDRGTLNRTGGFGAGVPATHLGTWSGTITVDPDYGNVTFPVELAIPGGMMSGIIGTIMISTSKCGGEITANALNGSTMAIHSNFTFGSCNDGDTTLTAQTDGTLLYEWDDPNSDRVDNGILTRISGPIATACVLPYFTSDTDDNLLRQDDGNWGGEPYGGFEDLSKTPSITYSYLHKNGVPVTISEQGCYLTSSAMMINYYAHRQGVSFETTPLIFNEWLRKIKGGYFTGPLLPEPPATPNHVEDSKVSPTGIQEYAKGEGIKVRPGERDQIRVDINEIPIETAAEFIERTRATVNADLCAMQPVILGVINGGNQHWVLATGQSTVNGVETWRIHDPYNTLLPTTLYEKYDNQYNAIRRYSGTIPGRSLSISVHSPVAVLLTDPSGRRTGYDPETDQIIYEIPGASYLVERIGVDGGNEKGGGTLMLFVPDAILGDYHMQVIETGVGPYMINISGTDFNGLANQIALHGLADGVGGRHYIVDYDGKVDSPVHVIPASVQLFFPFLE